MIIIVVFLLSCQTLKEDPFSQEECVDLNVQVPLARLPLYADISAYSILPKQMGSKASPDCVILKSLVDLNSVKISQWKENITFIQIPFLQNEVDILASITSSIEPELDKITRIKKFLVTKNTSGKKYSFVVTLVTENEYYKNHPDLDFLDRPNYTGAILFSSLEGELLMIRAYRNGLICPASVLNETESTKQLDSTMAVEYITLYNTSVSTKSEPGELDPSYCIAFRYQWIDPSYCYGDWYNSIYNGWNYPGFGVGSGISGGNSLDSDKIHEEAFPDEESYNMELYHYCPYEFSFEQGQEIISMIGSGRYIKGTHVYIDYTVPVPFSRESFVCSYWTGDFEDCPYSMPFLYAINQDTQATAYFDTPKPCSDETRHITNPLINMSITPSGGWNYYGGTFGMTRSGGTQMHSGLDLSAPIGTPVYAIYSGMITKVVSGLADKHIKRSFGNEIQITSERDDLTNITIQYAHLQSGNAIAINPRTGVPFSNGDRVNRGDLIGFTGRSGNAFNDDEVPIKHLHLGVKINDQYVNPADYINGTINASTIQSTHGRIDNIICD